MLALSRATTSCSQDGNAEYPVWIVSFMLPIFFVRLLVEWMALKRALLRFATLADFTIFGREVYFNVWFAVFFVCSQLAYADICTDCLFTSSSLKNLQCDPAIKSILHDTWHSSFLGWIPTPSSSVTIFGVWLLSLIQMCLPLLRTLGRTNTLSEIQHRCRLQSRIFTYPFFGNKQLSNSTVAFSLGDAAGMASLQALSIPFVLGIFARGFTSAFDLQLVDELGSQLIERLFLSCIIENCVQINVQATMYAANNAAYRLRGFEHEIQMRTLVSISLGMMMSLLKLFDVRGFQNVVRVIEGMAPLEEESDEFREQYLASARSKSRLLVLGGVLVIFSLLYAAATIVMAHVCNDSMWSLTGCVSLSRLSS